MPFWSPKTKKAGSSGTPPSPIAESNFLLQTQLPTHASIATKIRLSIAATAWIDALGAPQEFQKRGSFPFVTTMLPNNNFNLPPGVWTDDTSMMLCLAHSISTYTETSDLDGFNEIHQLTQYQRWYEHGFLSADGNCFDIGATIKSALELFGRYSPEEALLRIRNDLGGEYCSGNGSLMRILPIGLAYWRDESHAKLCARRSSEVTHPSVMCIEACEMWTCAISRIIQATTEPQTQDPQSPFSKFSLLEYISSFPYSSTKLRQSLTLPFGAPPRPDSRIELEQYYFRHHPLLRLIPETQGPPGLPKDLKFPYNIPPEDRLPSSGFVVHSLVAALYCFFATKTFEEGALMAVNLGDDADTVGAIYAGLAACWYAAEEGKANYVFWTKRVKQWRKMLVKGDLVEEIAEKLVLFEQKMSEEYL